MLKQLEPNQSIKDNFFNLSQTEQVRIYGEAVYSGSYEMLRQIRGLIPTKHKNLFLKMVEDYLTGKYGTKVFG